MNAFDACVVGAGPAGSAAALRLTQLGHRVCIIERARFPRAHVGESLSAGSWPVLESLGVARVVRAAGFRDAPMAAVRWSSTDVTRVTPAERGGGLMVDRARFDDLLLQSAALSGAQLIQPASIHSATRGENFWELAVEHDIVHARFLVNATGRSGFMRGVRDQLMPRMVALCAHVPLPEIALETRVEALPDGWCWGAPISDDVYSAMVFLDASTPVGRPEVERTWRSALEKSLLLSRLASAPTIGRVVARDATVTCATSVLADEMIRVGEAALTLDPLSSTGVEKALQGGAVAAAYVHTLLRHPDRSEACARFVRARHEETARVHARWTRGHYAEVTRFADRPFWQARAAAREDATANASREAVHIPALDSPMRLSPLLRLVEEPCLVHDEIDLRVSVQHPRLTRPVAFVDGAALAPLLDIVHDGITMGDVITQWSRVMPPNSLRHMVEWCVEQDLLEQMPAS